MTNAYIQRRLLSETAAKLALDKGLEIATSIGHTLGKYSHKVVAIVSRQESVATGMEPKVIGGYAQCSKCSKA